MPNASHETDVAMNAYEQKLAQRMLSLRECDQSVIALAWQLRVRYLILVVLMGLSVWLAFQTRARWIQPLGVFAGGMYLGALLRDIGWFRSAKRNWRIHRRLLDWDKVEALAEGREAADTIERADAG